MAQQKKRIKFPEKYKGKFNPEERKAIAEDIKEFIGDRTSAGKDVNNRKFPGYSKEYAKKKRSANVDLRLTGEMLKILEELGTLKTDRANEVTIGYERGSRVEGKVEGNRKGTYGRSRPIPGKKRDFLGLTQKDLKEILDFHLKRKEDGAREDET